MKPRQAAKSLVGALIAGLSALVPGLDSGLTLAEALVAVIAALIAGSAVFAVPNVAPFGEAASPELSEQDGRDLPATTEES